MGKDKIGHFPETKCNLQFLDMQQTFNYSSLMTVS